MKTETGAESGTLDTVKVDVVKVQIPENKAALKRRYWIGTLPDCPFQNISIAGLDFPRFIDPPRENAEGEYFRQEMKGKIVWLSDEQVEKIKKRVVSKILRIVGSRAFLRNVDDVGYYRDPVDQPLAKYVYMVRVADQMPADWRMSTYPEPMAS